MRGMGAQLMGAPGERLKLHPAHPSPTAQNPPQGRGRLALGIHHHPPACLGCAGLQQGSINAPILARHGAAEHRPIGFSRLTPGEKSAQLRHRRLGAAQHQTPRRVLIQPMRRLGQMPLALLQRGQVIFQARPTPRAAMHGQPRRLVDHQHGVGLEEDLRCHTSFGVVSIQLKYSSLARVVSGPICISRPL